MTKLSWMWGIEVDVRNDKAELDVGNDGMTKLSWM